jgi:hypothetical protein
MMTLICNTNNIIDENENVRLTNDEKVTFVCMQKLKIPEVTNTNLVMRLKYLHMLFVKHDI